MASKKLEAAVLAFLFFCFFFFLTDQSFGRRTDEATHFLKCQQLPFTHYRRISPDDVTRRWGQLSGDTGGVAVVAAVPPTKAAALQIPDSVLP